jgi:hypothetical protein
MKRLGIYASVLLMIILIGCGGRSNETETDINKEQVSSRQDHGDEEESPAQQRPKAPPTGWIKKISVSQQLEKEGTALIFKVKTTKPMTEDQYLSFIYWRNQEKITETPLNRLSPKDYKKGDLIYADVALYQEGQILERRRSELLQIKNSSPLIEAVRIPEIDGPGTYHIAVKAKDPDGDRITFSLEGNPLPQGLRIDPDSGTVTYVLGKVPPPEQVQFTITADDGDKGITKKKVTITFNITNPEENQ